jgi:hypothetical protein
LQAAANRAALDETLVLISDMPHSAWLAALPKSNLPMLTPDLPSTWRKTSSDKRQ